MSLLIGCIADDLTGATDVAVTFSRAGLPTIQLNGVPQHDAAFPDAAAIVIGLKSRTAPRGEAIDMSVRAMDWLRACGAERYYFKICSTFDSTPAGNIGPVADALCDMMGARMNLVTPAYPRNGRTVYQGHLFVGDTLVSESGMQDHPLTPMTDSNLVRVLAQQTQLRVGLLPHATTSRGPAALAAAIRALESDGCRHVIADAIDDAQLETLGRALAVDMLATGGAGLAAGLAAAVRDGAAAVPAARIQWPVGAAAILAGSCSVATLTQIDAVKDELPLWRLDPLQLERNFDAAIDEVLAWAKPQLGSRPILVYSSASPAGVAAAQAALGQRRASEVIERALKQLAVALAAAGVRRFVIAGGETSGAVVEALGVHALHIGPEIAAGVPWTCAADGKPYALALKSGNFGGSDFFRRAFEMLP